MQKNGILYIFIPYKREIILKALLQEEFFLNPSSSNLFKTVDQQILFVSQNSAQTKRFRSV